MLAFQLLSVLRLRISTRSKISSEGGHYKQHFNLSIEGYRAYFRPKIPVVEIQINFEIRAMCRFARLLAMGTPVRPLDFKSVLIQFLTRSLFFQGCLIDHQVRLKPIPIVDQPLHLAVLPFQLGESRLRFRV